MRRSRACGCGPMPQSQSRRAAPRRSSSLRAQFAVFAPRTQLIVEVWQDGMVGVGTLLLRMKYIRPEGEKECERERELHALKPQARSSRALMQARAGRTPAQASRPRTHVQC